MCVNEIKPEHISFAFFVDFVRANPKTTIKTCDCKIQIKPKRARPTRRSSPVKDSFNLLMRF